jgi:hypothetical protein
MKPANEDQAASKAEVAYRMADAVMYLSRVAAEVGMKSISAELLAIRKRLTRSAEARLPDCQKRRAGTE